MTTPKALSQEAEKMADSALEKEHYETKTGFLEKPYNRYRFHNGFVDGFNAGYFQAKKESEGLVEALKKIRDWADPEHYIAPQAVWAEQALKKYEVGE